MNTPLGRPTSSSPTTPDSTTTRLEAFSDGVLAIAITLLVLEVKVPSAGHGKLLAALRDQWPSYAAYALSFVVIGIMWVNHHGIFERIAHVDRPLLLLNLALLMGIAFLPFPTALFADYLREGGANSHVAAAVYGAAMVIIAAGFAMMLGYLARKPELLVNCHPAGARAAMRNSWAGCAVYSASIGLAFVSAVASLVLWAVMALYFTISTGWRNILEESDRP